MPSNTRATKWTADRSISYEFFFDPGRRREVVLDQLQLPVQRFGRVRDNPTIAFAKLGSTILDGLLGLDFFRGHILTVDFPRGTVTLYRPWRWFFRH